MTFPIPTPHPPELLGRPSRKAATAALKAHLAVLKGDPLKRALSEALQEAEALGGQERRFAALVTRELSRQQRLLDLAARQLGHPPGRWSLKEDQALVRYVLWRRLFTGEGWGRIGPEVKLPGPLRPRTIRDQFLEEISKAEFPETSLPPEGPERSATVHSFPNWFVRRLEPVVPPAELDALLAALNREPSLLLRVRPPGSREEVARALEGEGVTPERLPWAPDALRLPEGSGRVFESAPMKANRLQVQDLGSQLIVALCQPSPGTAFAGLKVLDACAGAGGKTLALADLVGPGGRVFASDRSRKRLGEARTRASRFGLRNVSFPEAEPLGDVDVLLIDAPCSGSGSVAREPDQKWKLTEKAVQDFQKTQLEILHRVAAGARPGALIVYATCSLFREEDEDVVSRFLSEAPGFEVEDAAPLLGAHAAALCAGPFLRVLPHRVAGGGFFAARLRKKAGA